MPRAFPFLLLFPALTAAQSAAPLSGQPPYIVGPNIQVSRAQATLRFQETQIAADPVRAGHLIACAIAWRNDSTENVFYISFDDGTTWAATLTVRPGVDPSCVIDRRGVAIAGTIHDSVLNGSDSFLNIQRSADGGLTWRNSSIRAAPPSIDRSYITVEEGRGPLQGRVYVHGYVNTSMKRLTPYVVLYASSDSGRTFDRPVPISAAKFTENPWFFPANGIITADGAFAALIVELDKGGQNMFAGRSDSASAPHTVNGVLRLLRSTDGGHRVTSFQVSDAFYDSRVPQLSMSSLAADRGAGPFAGRLYAAWPDARSERRTQIFLASSDDQGRTWSAPRVVSDDAGALKPGDRPNNFMPMITVNSAGVVGLTWYDRRESPNNLSYMPRFAASLDGGATWLPSIAVSSSPEVLTPTDRVLNGGDKSGLTADVDGVFHVLWIDNRTGINQVWTTTVKVGGTVRR
jgi:hypothetical protein